MTARASTIKAALDEQAHRARGEPTGEEMLAEQRKRKHQQYQQTDKVLGGTGAGWNRCWGEVEQLLGGGGTDAGKRWNRCWGEVEQ